MNVDSKEFRWDRDGSGDEEGKVVLEMSSYVSGVGQGRSQQVSYTVQRLQALRTHFCRVSIHY
jgi:hypothetical protein